MDATQLMQFLSNKMIVSGYSDEGMLSVLTSDIRKEIWRRIDSDNAFAQAYQVNQKWRDEILLAWKEFCSVRGFFVDADFFSSQGRDWTWILKCKVHQFKEGEIKNGPGMIEESGSIYEGEFANDKKEGLGKKMYADKSVYIGQWSNDMKQGQGKCVWEDGTFYSGLWVEDKYHGFGVKSWAN
jgi:hypothetical protein